MLHVEPLSAQDSDRRCSKCKKPRDTNQRYCRACRATYERGTRLLLKQKGIADAETTKRHQQYFDGIEDETLP